TVFAIGAAARGTIPSVVPMILLVVNIVVSNSGRRRLVRTLGSIASDDRRIVGYADLFAEAASPTFANAEARDVQARAGKTASAAALRRLERILTLGDLRFSPMAHIIAQAVLLWDTHVIDALDTWRRSNGARVESWLQAMAELETCVALATLAHDNPEWCFPTLEPENGGAVECAGLAHPLLSFRVRVANDVTIGPSNTVLFVTGPNMAGKSTLLRSIGVNVVLAQAGGPVCAERMRLGAVRLRTSIHVQDAFEEGVSLFMAELIRVKRIVDASREERGAPVLYLIDEMLRGTNAEERHIAVASVLTHLTATGAIGVVATHDLELARAPSLAGRARSVHFTAELRESVSGPRVQFDFRLRPGPATQRNAMRLVEMLGLGAAATRSS
ncbi:MAG TPA: hypothetical protein VHV78_08250, partial [Gemmatimonadaceae bacterium]|nr:hypothetical protein [Gemmatimonadaceae bacterium]